MGEREISGLAKGNSRSFSLSFLAWSWQHLPTSAVHEAGRADKRCHGPMRDPLNDFVITLHSPTEQYVSHPAPHTPLGLEIALSPGRLPLQLSWLKSDSAKAHLRPETASQRPVQSAIYLLTSLFAGYISSVILPPPDHLSLQSSPLLLNSC